MKLGLKKIFLTKIHKFLKTLSILNKFQKNSATLFSPEF
jgi:hypothetical protein